MDHLKNGLKWVKENPGTAAGGAATATGLTIAAVPAIVTAPVLGFLGFGAGGVVGGSIAASIQAGIGNVLAGSVFSTLTSAAMGGYGAAVVATAGQAVGAVTATAGAVGAYVANKPSQGDTEMEEQVEKKEEDVEGKKDHVGNAQEEGPRGML